MFLGYPAGKSVAKITQITKKALGAFKRTILFHGPSVTKYWPYSSVDARRNPAWLTQTS